MNSNGHRNERGQFVKGCPPGPGRPEAGAVQRLRDELFVVVSPSRFRKVLDALLTKAESGDTTAAKIVLERTLGTPLPADIIERIESLEETLHGALER